MTPSRPTPLAGLALGAVVLASVSWIGAAAPAQAAPDLTMCNGKAVTTTFHSSITTTGTGTPGDDVVAVDVDQMTPIAVSLLAGNDTVCVFGNNGYVTVDAGDGDDFVSTGGVTINHMGVERVLLGAGNDTFVGGAYGDRVEDTGAPASGDDSITTGSGDDDVHLYSGTDTVALGTGYNGLTVEAAAAGSWEGGPQENGFDGLTIDSGQVATARTSPTIEVDLDRGTFLAAGTTGGTLSGFEAVAVTGYRETLLVGTAGADRLNVESCRIRLDGGAGNDQIDLDHYRMCPSPAATARGGAGNDFVRGTSGTDALFGDGGRDTLYGRGGADVLDGGGSNDHLFGDPGNDVLRGGGGKDTLTGDGGRDTAYGDAGRDTCKAERTASCEKG